MSGLTKVLQSLSVNGTYLDLLSQVLALAVFHSPGVQKVLPGDILTLFGAEAGLDRLLRLLGFMHFAFLLKSAHSKLDVTHKSHHRATN